MTSSAAAASASIPARPVAAGSTPRLTVHLDAIADNWRALAAKAPTAEAAAVVKADAYGTGLAPAASALHEDQQDDEDPHHAEGDLEHHLNKTRHVTVFRSLKRPLGTRDA